MAIEAYTGMPGDGKTYEVVKSVIVPAIRRGQRVVTNIRGLDPEAIGKHLGFPPGRVAMLIKQFDIEDAMTATGLAPDFFPTEGGEDDGILEWGAYNVIDEAHFVFGTGSKFDNRGKYFLRQHRHEESDGQSTQIVVITQSIDDLTASVKNVVRSTTRCIKKTMYGNHKAYFCRKFMGATEAPGKALNEISSKYEAPYIHMYKSQRHAVVNEKGVDNRGSIWTNRKLQAGIVVALLATVFLIYSLVTMNSRLKHSADAITPGGVAAASHVSTSKGAVGTCKSPIILTETNETGMKMDYIKGPSGLVAVAPLSVSGFGSARFSSVCP